MKNIFFIALKSILWGLISCSGYTLTANFENLNGSGDISYQWKRCDTEDTAGTDIIKTNGTGSDFILVEADINKYIKVTVSRACYSGSETNAATEALAGSPYGDYFGMDMEL